MNDAFRAATRYAKQIPKMKPRNRREGVMRLLAKLKAALAA